MGNELDESVQGVRVLIVEENSWIPIDRRVWQEATALRDAGAQVSVICPAATGAHAGKGDDLPAQATTDELDGISVYRFPLNFAESGVASYFSEYLVAFISIARLSWQVWRSRGFDILQLCNPPDIFFPVGLLYRILGAKIIFDHHDLFPESALWRFRGPMSRIVYALARAAEYLTFSFAHVVIATNESFRQIAIGRGKVPSDRVIVVRNGPLIDEFVPVEPVAELRSGFTYMVGYVGVMGHGDGVLELVGAIQYIVNQLGRRDILFAFLGDGSLRQQALDTVKEFGLEPYVDMPGMIQDDFRLRQYMSSMDVFASPEPYTPMNAYSTFIKIGEYMAIGKPIVAFDLHETRHTAQDAAIYVAPGNIHDFGQAIVDLLDDPERRKRAGEVGRKRILTELGWDHQIKHLLRAYALAQC